MFVLVAFAFALIAAACHNPIVWDESPDVTASEEAEWSDLATWHIDDAAPLRVSVLASVDALRSAMIANGPLVARLRTSDADRYRTMMRVRSVSNARYSAAV